MAGVWHLKRIWEDAFRVAGAVQETYSSEMLEGETGCILEPEIFRFAGMILRDRCSTSYDLASLFRGRRSSVDKWIGKIANSLVRGRQRCTQLATFHFWRKSSRIASFLMLSSSKIEEVSQNCLVFDVVKFNNWGSLAELFRRFWRCQVQNWGSLAELLHFQACR